MGKGLGSFFDFKEDIGSCGMKDFCGNTGSSERTILSLHTITVLSELPVLP